MISDIMMRYKVYITRAGSYIAMINAGMILYIFLSQFDGMRPYFILIYPLSFVAMILVGYIDEKAGLYKKEFQRINNNNMQLQEILDILKKRDADGHGDAGLLGTDKTKRD